MGQDLEVAREDHTLFEARDIKIKSKLLPVNIKESKNFMEDQKRKEANYNNFKQKLKERDHMMKKIGIKNGHRVRDSFDSAVGGSTGSDIMNNPLALGKKIVEEHKLVGNRIFTEASYREKKKKSPKKTQLTSLA
mmetsp:Transcript_6226/g.10142  ORF Transcript_6226/g.10142 Transcript_6226/m.10142 type:complete len:135 (+) Transcript_6226:348-752(+)